MSKGASGSTIRTMSDLRVLFLHALESRPGTLKHKYLEVFFPRTQCPYLRSPVWMQRLRLTLALIVLFAVLGIVGIWLAFAFTQKVKLWMACVGTVGVLLFGYGIFILLKRYMLRCALEEATAIANEAYEVFRPHVVVSASFGSVVSVNMKQREVPLLMLGPAIQLFNSHAGLSDKLPDLSVYPFVTIVHGSEDSTVPLQDSVKLYESTKYNCQVEIITGGDHRLSSFTEEELREYIHATVFKADPKSLTGLHLAEVGGAQTPPQGPPQVAIRAAGPGPVSSLEETEDQLTEPLLGASDRERHAALAAWHSRGRQQNVLPPAGDRNGYSRRKPQPEEEPDGTDSDHVV